MSQPPLTPGWYPDPSDPSKKMYWDGSVWRSFTPAAAPTSKSDTSRSTAIAVGVCVLAVVGTMMSMQSASLLTGTGSLWMGVGVAGAAVAVAFFMGGAVWVRIVACILLAISLFSVLYMENQITEKRNELTQIFNN